LTFLFFLCYFFGMQPIEYTLNLQRLLLVLLGFSFLLLSGILVFFDPFSQFWSFWVVLFLVTIIMAIVQIFLLFWWYFFIRKVILSLVQVNSLVYQSLTISTFTTYLFLLWHTGGFNNFSLALVIFMMSSYILFWRA
jgi:hypothetical protein